MKGGRPRRLSASDRLRALDFDPLKEMVAWAMQFPSPSKERYEVSKELIAYQHPKLRSTEHTPGEGATVTVTIGSTLPNEGKELTEDELLSELRKAGGDGGD